MVVPHHKKMVRRNGACDRLTVEQKSVLNTAFFLEKRLEWQ